MRKLWIILLCLMVCMTGCKQERTAAPTNTTDRTETESVSTIPSDPQVETEPQVTEPPVPDTVTAVALADHTDVVLTTVDRDESIDIAGEFDENYYVVKLESGYGLIERCLVRMDGEAVYAQWDGYAYHGAVLYDNYHLLPGGEKELSKNTIVRVLDCLDGCYVVQLDETIGYVRESQISKTYIKPYSGGGGQDGGDISLSYGDETSNLYTNLSLFVPQSGEVSGKGIVLVNGAEIILGWFDRDDSMQIIAEAGFAPEQEGWYSVYLNGTVGYVRQNLSLMDGAEPYMQWNGYSRSGAEVFDNYYLNGESVKTLSTNTDIHVVCDLGACYLVSIGETIGYMNKDHISETRITYNGGGESEWSDPVM